mgnify:CR=1 FL=1
MLSLQICKNIPRYLVAARPIGFVVPTWGTTATSGFIRQLFPIHCQNPRSAPAHSASTTSLTLTPNRVLHA